MSIARCFVFYSLIFTSIGRKFKNGNKTKENNAKSVEPKPSPQPKTAPPQSSLSEFLKDQEFIEFLKNVALFCTEEDDDEIAQRMGQNRILYKNLIMLREKFQTYKRSKLEKDSVEDESENEDFTTLTRETGSYDMKSQIEFYYSTRNSKFLVEFLVSLQSSLLLSYVKIIL